MVLDAAQLDAINQEARTCFLYEDAPDYLDIFEQGMQRLYASSSGDGSVDLQIEYTALMRAAHSLKGGAGIAQLPSLSQLAHKLEDLLQVLHQDSVPEPGAAYELLSLGVEQISRLIAEAISGQGSAVEPKEDSLPILTALDSFLEALPQTTPAVPEPDHFQTGSINPYLLKTALEIDLGECLQRVEQLVQSPVNLTSLQQVFADFVEECSLLGQALSLPWLTNTVELARQELAQGNAPVEQIITITLEEIRRLRSQALSSIQPTAPSIPVSQTAISQEKSPPAPLNDQGEATPAPAEKNQASAVTLNLRIPVSRLDRMNNMMGELLIGHERLTLYQEQLQQTSLALKARIQQFEPLTGQVKALYDRLATPLAATLVASTPEPGDESAREFDPLELDRYTEFHSTLQDSQELMVRVRESQADIELINHELQESLAQLRLQLDSLRGDLTASRLVPFKLLADRFVTPLQTLNQRYQKSVELVVAGADTLVDQVILEQLQTPLTHLVRNAFDHGIEPDEERLALDKSLTGQIDLSATVQGNQVVITVQDDGRGIDSQKVYQRAVQMGLCSVKASELTHEQILDFLFISGFSTAAKVTELSGRGVGLDIVKLQVERLRGLVRVDSVLGQGTKFTITIPLTLSILPLLLCRCQQTTLAIPSINVLEIKALSEFSDSTTPEAGVIWHNRRVSLFPLMQLLPYRQQVNSLSSTLEQQLGIVLDVKGEPIVVTVDSLLLERELVLKPFEPTIPVPTYVTGCTVLGSGEVVPVLSPSHFGELVVHYKQSLTTSSQTSRLNRIQSKSGSDGISTILIVDDSIAVRRLMERVLSQSGYQVVQCRDGKEALEKLNRSGEHFDCVISDIEMPRLDGFGLLKEIRTHARWHSLPVAMLTSRENDRHRRKAMSLGATDYLTKPFHPERLLETIGEMLKTI